MVRAGFPTGNEIGFEETKGQDAQDAKAVTHLISYGEDIHPGYPGNPKAVLTMCHSHHSACLCLSAP